MSASLLRSIGNKVYEHAFPIYRLFYRAFKAYTDCAERQLLRKMLFPGAVVVDVGANIGIYSEFLSHCVGPTGLVHSFEPSPDNFRRLSSATHDLSNVRLTQAAVGEASGECKLYVSDKLNVDHRAYKADGDIQGYELHALHGAQRVLQENPDINLLLEFWPAGLKQAGVGWEELVKMLQGLNMNLTLVRTCGLVPFDAHDVRNDISWYVNLFAHRSPGQIHNWAD
jgi:hypothetical protein